MANKKHKAAPKKPAKKTAKPAAKSTPAKPVKAAKPAAKKPVAKPAAKKVVPAPVKKPAAVPVAKQPQPQTPAKPEAKPAATPVAKKPGAFDPKSLVSIKPTAKPVIKKEPPKPAKVSIPKTTTKSAVKYEPEFTKSVLDTPMFDQTGPTMRYSDADLAEFREIINKKLDAAKKELAYLQGLITRRDEGGDMDEARYMTMEDGSVSMEREQLSQMASRQITFIDHLEKAIMRIENKTYGVCRVTGRLIDKARLRAVPHATLSIEAKQMMNK
jgi:RNA polymerase-binding transcription factor DksA